MVVAAAAGVIVLTFVGYIWRRRREAAYTARRQAELRKQYNVLHMREQEIERLGDRIVATSSTQTIAGFAIIRQVEAVFTDGHRTPAKAVAALKALAAQKGANALINLNGERLPSGKCVARGDAVVVRPPEGPPPLPPHAGETLPETPLDAEKAD
ncbi:MAG: hypothetical protein KKB50_18310 [Planctomycetes bacterium]|nr:hypothetical protein [Planctomycetota bacterium]